MAYQDVDFLDEANLIDIPCEFCNDLFPMILLMEHQTACRPDLVRVVEPTIEELQAQFLDLEDNLPPENSKHQKRIDPPINRNWISIAEIPATVSSKERTPINKISQSELAIYGSESEQSKASIYIAVIFKIIYMLGTGILSISWFILKIIFKILMLLWNSESDSNENVNHEVTEKFAIDEEDQEAIEKALLQENEAFTFGSSKKGKIVEEEKLSFKYPPNPLLNTKDCKQHIHNDLTESDNEENESLEEFWTRADIKLVQRLRMLQKKSLNLQ